MVAGCWAAEMRRATISTEIGLSHFLDNIKDDEATGGQEQGRLGKAAEEKVAKWVDQFTRDIHEQEKRAPTFKSSHNVPAP